MNVQFKTFKFAAIALSLALASCGDDDSGDSKVNISQSDVDESTIVWELGITGDQYGASVSIPHGGMNLTSAETNRDVYGNQPLSDDIEPGTIVTKRTYLRNSDGSNGDLLATFAMVKRESGFWGDGNDWEYYMMPFNAGTDYAVEVNGNIASAANSGKLESCNACHSNGTGTNYLFVK